MHNLEQEVWRALGISKMNRTIPLNRGILDDPLRFVHYNPASYDRTLRRLSYYSVYLWHHRTMDDEKYYPPH